MTHATPRPPHWILLLAWAGGVLFVAALVTGAASYVRNFGAPVVFAPGAPVGRPIAIDTLLFSVFALHHSLFARTPASRWVRTLAPAAAERTIYVWIASILFIAVCVWWQPVPGLLWSVEPPIGWLLAGVQVAGVVLTGLASRRLSVFALAGIRQAEGAPTGGALVADGSYAVVRHPIYLAWLLMVWPAPQLTATRAVFAALSSLYLMAAVPFEERALRRMFGERYATYAQRVRWRMIPFVY
jgi:protein-S-isoprenylcysteine O-methyltransferase Ste14